MKRILYLFLLVILPYSAAQAQTLVHYWNFNTSTTEQDLLTPSTSLVSGSSIQHIAGGTSQIQITSNTAQGFEITNPNARNGDAAATHLRFNNPIGGTLVFSLPTTGYNAIVITYAARRSGQGAGTQYIEYTTDGTNYQYFDTIAPPDGNPSSFGIDFSALTTVNNNANFKIRITFDATGGGTSGNNRFDNFSLEGNALSGDVTPPQATFNPANNSVSIPNNVQPTITFNEDIRLINNTALNNTNVDAVVELRLDNASGALVSFDATITGKVITVVPGALLLPSQNYYLSILGNQVEDLANNAFATTQSVTFTTLSLQTVFQPGDIVPVAYRMNATATDDEFAFLTLVNILPGTRINFTDAKYTDNTQAQCAGGFTWEAPAAGVASGTVISIKNDANPPVVSVGTAFGSGFGLSSGGDQIVAYTGTASSPSHVMALSSNAWLANNASCSGSESKLPTTLTAGTSAISLSTAPGNVTGNTVNAFYTGTMTGTPAQLRTAILNPANWNGVGAGTAPQTWPTWSFPGPPSIISAKTLHQTAIQLVFNRPMDAPSTTNVANYTGISGLSSVTMTANGNAADTVTLTFSSPFITGNNYTLVVDNVRDADLVQIFTPYSFMFTYTTSVKFNKAFLVVNENDGQVTVELDVVNPSQTSLDLVLKPASFSTAGPTDLLFTAQNLVAGSSKLTVQIPITEDAVKEQDEYFVLSLENSNGVQIIGSPFLTVYIKDNDRKAPTATKEIELIPVTSFSPTASGSTTEIVVYDAGTKRLFTTSAIQDRLDIINFSNPAVPVLIKSVDMTPYGGITSVAVYNGIVAVASPNANEQLNGSVVIFSTNGDFQKQVTVGALPDMITFSPDGKMILTANEGQPNNAYTVDPEGSVSIIDISGGIANLSQTNVTTVLFTAFNPQEPTLIASGVRKTWAASTLSQDFEPEYITIHKDGKRAWVTLQENNAIAEINLETKTITSVWALGTKDANLFGNGFDASDKTGVPLLANWNVKAFFMPDAVVNFQLYGVNYLLTANEGDEKEYGPLNERTTVGSGDVVLNPAIYPNAEILKQDHNLGRLRITNLNGKNSQGEYDQLYMVGPRSFTIWNADTKSLVYESGDALELITSQDPVFGVQFNADNEGNGIKSRSRSKGPEPEGATVAKIGDETYAFIGLERIGGVMVFNITNPNAPVYVDYNNLRNLTTFAGDNGPEGIIYIAPQSSPNGKAYLVVANEISGSLSIFEVNKIPQTREVAFSSSNTLMLPEAGSRVQISINLDAPAQATSTITLKIQNGTGAIYGTDYSLSTAPKGDSIVLTVAKGASSANFTVTPLNDVLIESNETVNFQIASVSEFVKAGTTSSFTVTIESDDANGVTTINGREHLRAYPNPIDASFDHLSFNKSISLVVYDLQGKKVMEAVDVTQINVSLFVRGTYLIRTSEGESLSFIKK